MLTQFPTKNNPMCLHKTVDGRHMYVTGVYDRVITLLMQEYKWHNSKETSMLLGSHKSRATWKHFVLPCSFLCSLSSCRQLPSKMLALPGSSLTTHPALDALAKVWMKLSSVVWTFHYSILASVRPTTIQLKLQHLGLVRTLHSILPLLTIFSCQKMYPYLMSLCVDHWIEKVNCVESVKMAMALHYTHTLWNAVSAGDTVMDGSCTFSWNFSQ